MNKNKEPKTTGDIWLEHSMTAFNGSGYADKTNFETYIASYRAYKLWRRDKKAVRLVDQHPWVADVVARRMMLAKAAGHTPTHKNYATFMRIYKPTTLQFTFPDQERIPVLH